jgi:hypothetical protein
MEANMQPRSLLPLTKLVLAVSGVVQLVFGLAGVFAPSLARSLLAVQADPPLLAVQFVGAVYLANCAAAFYALRQNQWVSARTYLLGAALFVALAVAITLEAAISPQGIQPTAWLYLFLSALYLPVVVYMWLQETKQGSPMEHGLAHH